MCSPNEEVEFVFKKPVGCVIDVRGMYKFLAERASHSGTNILTGVRAEYPLLDGNRVIGCSAKGETGESYNIYSKIVIDAGGYRSSISKKSGLHSGFTRFGVGSEYDMVAPNCRQDEALLIVGNRYAPSGYAWVFPWGQSRVRVGVGILHADARANPQEHLKIFLEEADSFGVDLSGAEIKEHHYGMMPAEGVASQLVGDGIMAVGDAAGQASLVVGEGIRLCMLAGQLAGTVAVQALQSGRFDRQVLEPYEQLFRSKYGRNLIIGHIMNERMATYDDAKWDDKVRLLKAVPPSLLLKFLQSEFSPAEIVPWIATRPNLWPRAIRYGVKGLLSYARHK